MDWSRHRSIPVQINPGALGVDQSLPVCMSRRMMNQPEQQSVPLSVLPALRAQTVVARRSLAGRPAVLMMLIRSREAFWLAGKPSGLTTNPAYHQGGSCCGKKKKNDTLASLERGSLRATSAGDHEERLRRPACTCTCEGKRWACKGIRIT
jgi:hypothetical protein